MTFTEIAADFKADLNRVVARYLNSPPDAIGSIRVSSAKAALAHIDALEAQAASCTCGASAPQFEPQERADEGRFVGLHFARLANLRRVDEAVEAELFGGVL